MDDDDGNNMDRNGALEEDGAIRRNQVLIFGVILLGILAICLAVSMPSDLEFNEAELPTGAVSMNSDASDRPSIPTVDATGKRNNQTNSTRKKTLRNPEVSVEVKLLRDMAIQKKIQEYYGSSSSNSISKDRRSFGNEAVENDQGQHPTDAKAPRTKEEIETTKVNNIVDTFIGSEDFEDFLLDMEIHDAVKRLKEERGYKSKPTTIFDELFKRAEKEFIGEDEEELKLIKRVGEELERRAREIINKRKESRGEGLTEPEELLASELLKSEFSGSGGDSMEEYGSDEESEIIDIQKTEL